MSKIKHRELLIFSNLTNLDWHFVELYKPTTGRKKNNTFLKDLLKPESFIDKNRKGKFEKYVYMENVKKEKDISQKDIEEGKAELRKNAGIAMEYLEKWQEEDNDEGSFIEDWEVIYAADNYKVVADYLDDLYYIKNGRRPEAEDKDYRSRNEIEKFEKYMGNVEVVVKGLEAVEL